MAGLVFASGRALAGSAVLPAILTLAGGAAMAQGADPEELERLRDAVQELEDRYRREIDALKRRIRELGGGPEGARGTADGADEAAAPVTPAERGVTVEISGRVSQGLLYAANGEDSRFFVADNDNSGSRIGVLGSADLGERTANAYLEVGLEFNSTDELDFDQEEPAGDDFPVARHVEAAFEHPAYGMIAVGQGDAATEDAAEADVSEVDVVAESDVDDLAGGLEVAGGVEVDEVFQNLDGDRAPRIRYDTPALGFGDGGGKAYLAASVREDNGLQPGVALIYE